MQDEIPQGPVSVSLQDISRRNRARCLSTKRLIVGGEDVNSEDGVSQEDSERENEGESSQSNWESSEEYEGEASAEEEGESSEVESNSDKAPLVEVMEDTPVDQVHDAKPKIIKVTQLWWATSRKREGNKAGLC